jgi:hypothetical protein
VGSLDGDLAVTGRRWPMSPAERERFLAAYARRRDPSDAVEHARFWRLRDLVKSAHVRIVRLGREEREPVRALRALLAEGAAP